MGPAKFEIINGRNYWLQALLTVTLLLPKPRQFPIMGWWLPKINLPQRQV
jgi:hypothetical protein